MALPLQPRQTVASAKRRGQRAGVTCNVIAGGGLVRKSQKIALTWRSSGPSLFDRTTRPVCSSCVLLYGRVSCHGVPALGASPQIVKGML